MATFKHYDESFKQFSQVKLEDNTMMTAKKFRNYKSVMLNYKKKTLSKIKVSAIFLQNSKSN